ncbi:serine-rich adhesin for platelets-like [Macrobrachium rosenbergii]|uniref:serine-rich adhesin for platelets-like n=1 Tax=Macrobrachium rosenbergii TaxID=79674 RepID=UPI0034D4CDB4
MTDNTPPSVRQSFLLTELSFYKHSNSTASLTDRINDDRDVVPDVPRGVGTLRAVLTVLTIATCAAATAPSEDPKSIPEALPARTQPSEMFMIHQQDPFDQVAMETFEHRVYLNPASNFSSLVENGPVLVNGGVYEATQTGGLYEATQTDVENINIIYAKPQNSITLTTLQSTSLLPLSEIDTLTPLDKGDTFTISYNETLTIPGDNETHSTLDITEATTPISDDMHAVPEIKQLTTPTQDIAFIPVNGNSDAHTSTNNIILTTLKDSNTNRSPNITTTVTKLQLRETGTTQATDEYTDLSNNTFLSLSNNTWEKQGFTDGVSTNTLDLLAQPSKQLVLQYLPCNSTHQAALSTNLEVAQGDNSVTSVNSTKTSVPTDSLLISIVVQSATNSSTLQNETSTQESLHGKRQVSPQPKQFFGPYSPQIPPYLESYYSHLHSDQPFLLPENIFGPPKRPEPFALRRNRPRPHSRKRLPPKRRRVRPHKQEVEDSVHSVISPETGGIDDPYEEFESDESLDYTIDPPQEYGLKLTPDKQYSKDTGNNTQPLNNFDEKVKIKYNSPEEVQQRFPPPGKQSSQSPILPAILASTTPADPNDRSIFSSSFPTTVYPPVISTISSEKIPTQNDQENILKGDNFRHQVYIPQGNVLVEKETNISTTSEVQVTNLKDNGHESSLDDYTEGSTDNNQSLNAHSVYDSIGNPSPIEDNYSSHEHIDEISQFGENEQDAIGSPLEENLQEKRSPLLNINTDLYEGPNGSPKDSVEYSTGIPSIPQNINKIPNIPSLPQGNYPLSILQELAGLSALSQGQQIVPVTSVKPVTSPSITFLPSFSPPSSTLSNFPTTPRIRFQEDATTLNVGPQPVTWQTSNEYRSTNKPVQLFAALSSHNNDPNIQQQGFHTTHCKENKETTDSSELGNTNAQQNIKREVDISFPQVSREHGAPLVLVGKEQDPALLLVDKNRGIPVSNTQNQDIRQGNTIVPNSTNKLPSIQRDTISTTNSFSPETASVDPTSLLKPSVASSPSKEERISLNKNNESTITHDQPVDDTLTNPDNLHVTPLDGFKIDTNKEVTQIETPLLEQQNSRELNNDRIQNFVTVSPEILPSFQTESLIKDIIATTYTPLHEPEALRKLKSLFGFPNSKAQSTSKSTTTNLPDLNLALGSGLVVDDQILQNIQMLLQTDNPPSGVVLSPKDLFKNLEEVIKNSKGSSHSLLKEQANERGSSNTNSTIQPTERAKINLNAMKRLTAIKMSDESDIPAIIRNFIAAQKPPRSSSTPIDVNLQNSTQSPVQKVKMPDLITSLQAMMSEANKSSTGESIISESGLPTMKTNRENNDRTNTNNSDEGEFIILISDESTIYPKDGEFIVIIPHSPSTSYLSEIFPQKPNGRSVRQGDLKDYFIDVDAIENSDDSYISSSNKLYSTARQGIPNTQHANFSDVLQENESNDPSPLQDSEYNGISFRKSTPVLPSENGTFSESSIRNWFEPHTGGLGMTNLDQNEHGKQRDLNITGATWINTPDLHTILNQINDTFTSNNKPPLRSPQQFGYFYEGQYPQYWYGSPVGAIEYPDLLTPALDKRHGPNYNTLQLITAERAELLEEISSDDQTTNLSNTGTGNYEIFAPQTETDFNANITGQLNEHPELAEAINSDDTIVDYDFAEYHDGKTQASGDRVSDYHFPGSNSDIPLGLPGKDFHYDSSLVSLALDNINISTTNLSKAKWDGKLGNTNTSNHSTTDGRKNTTSVPPEGERPQREVSLDGSLPFDDRLESGLKVTGNATTVNLGSTTLSDDSNMTTFQGIPLDVLEYIRKGVLERIPETNTEQFIEKGTHFQPKAESSDVDNREQLTENTKIFPQSLESQISGKLNEYANSSSSKTRQAITDNRGKNDSVFGTLSISSNFTANQKSIPSNTEKSDSGQTVTAKEKSGLRNNYFIPDTIVTILPTIALGTNRIPNGTRQFATNTTSNVTKSNTPKNISVPTPLSNAGLKVQETNTNDNSTLSPGLSNDDLSHDARENTHSEVLSNQSSDSGVLTQNKKTTASESRSLQSTTLSTIELKVINVTTNPVTSVNNNPSLGSVLNGFENVGNVSPDSLTNRFHPNVTFTDKIPVSTPSTDLQDTSRDNIFKSHKNETESENRNNSKSKDDDSVDGRIVDIDFGIVPRDTLSIANNAENFPFGDGSFDNTNEGIKQSNFAQENNSANGTTINTNTFSLHNQLGANRKSNLGQMVNTNKNSSQITDNTRDVRVNIKHTVQQPQKLNDPLQDINVDNARTPNITQDSQSARENIAGSIQSNSTSNQMIAEGENPSFINISNINFGHIPEITNLSGLTIDFQLPGIQVVDITPIAQPKPNSQVDSSKSSNRVLKTPLINIPNSVVKPQDSFKNDIPILEEFNGGIQSDLSNTRLTTRSPTGSNTGGVTNADTNEGFTTGVNNLLPVNTQTLQDSTRVNNLLQVNKQTLQDSTRVNNLLQVNTQTLQDSTRVNNLLQVNTQTLQDSTRGLLPNVANYANYFIPSSVANSNDATTESPLRKGIPGQTDPVDGSKLTREINEVLLANAEPLELDGIVFEKVDASTLQKPGSSINDGGPFPEISHTGAHTFDSNEPIILLDSPVKLVSIEEQSKIVLPVAPHVVTSSTVLGDNDDLYSDYVDAQENLDFDYSVTEQQPNNSNQGNSDSFGKLNIPGSVNHNQGKPAGTPTLPPIIVGSPLGTGKPLPPSSFSPTPTIGKIVETTTTTVFLPIPVSPVPKTPTVALQIPQKLSPHLAANLFRPQDTKTNLGGSQTQDQIDKWVWRGVNGLPLRNLPVRRHKSISGGSLSTGQNQHSTPYKQTGQSVNRQIPRPGNQEPKERWIWEDVNRRGLAPELISSNPDDIEAWFKDNYLLTPNVVSYLYKKLDALTEDLDAATKITTPAILGRTITRQPRYWPNNYKQTDIGTSAGTGLTNGFYQMPLYSHNS